VLIFKHVPMNDETLGRHTVILSTCKILLVECLHFLCPRPSICSGYHNLYLDTGVMTSIIQPGTKGTGSRVQLEGVTGDAIQVEITDVTFPVLTSTNELS
jgi:hypothetical protein